MSRRFSATLLVIWLSTQTVIFLFVEVSEGYFASHTSLSFVFQYVGVIFNHNITPSSSLNTHVFLFVQTLLIYGRLQFSSDHFRFLSSLSVAGCSYQISFFPSDYKFRSDQIFYWPFVFFIIHSHFMCQFCFC